MSAVVALPGLGRRLVASAWAGALLPFLVLAVVVPVARAVGVFEGVSVPFVALVSVLCAPLLVLLFPRLAASVPVALDDWLAPKVAWLWGASTLVAIASLTRIAIFLGAPGEVWASFMPGDSFLAHHSCLTAYVHGAILSKDPGANVYDLAFVTVDAHLPAALPSTAAGFAPFTLDAFGYPPPFLLLPRALLLLTTDFASQRIIVAALSLVLVLVACAVTARTLGGAAERRLWLLTPLFVAHPLAEVTLQIGNFHLIAVALCLMSWALLEQQRNSLGGALLAVATLSKIFPGLLGVLLLVQLRWRAVAWTCVAAVGLVALSVGVLGTRVWNDFLFYHLPHVQSGEALRFLAAPQEVEFNSAPFGLPFKFAALGFEGGGWGQAAWFGTLYTGFLVVLAVLAGRVSGSPSRRLMVWLSVLVLASLRSPYAAPFVMATVMLLVLVMLAAEVPRWSAAWPYIAVGVALSIPTPPTEAKVAIVVSLVRMAIVFSFLLWVVLRDLTLKPKPG